MDVNCFRHTWSNHQKTFQTGFKALLQEEALVDVTLVAEGKLLKAHKAVLSVCSTYFSDLFKIIPYKHQIVVVTEGSYNALAAVIQFMYTGEVIISLDESHAFMKLIEILKVQGLDNWKTEPEVIEDIKTEAEDESNCSLFESEDNNLHLSESDNEIFQLPEKRDYLNIDKSPMDSNYTVVKGFATKKINLTKDRQLRPTCSEKCRWRCFEKFSENERQAIFDKYWALDEIVKQRYFIIEHMQKINRSRTNISGNYRSLNNAFYFKKGEQNVRVCQTFFIATLDITRRTVRTVILKRKNGFLGDLRGKHDFLANMSEKFKEIILNTFSNK